VRAHPAGPRSGELHTDRPAEGAPADLNLLDANVWPRGAARKDDGALSLAGYTTKKSLSGMGSFLIMGLIGLVIASVVNIFLASSALSFAISAIGVLVFAGLTAWDTQRIKEMYFEGDDVAVAGRKAIMGALQLYLDFINLFTFLLQFLGDRR